MLPAMIITSIGSAAACRSVWVRTAHSLRRISRFIGLVFAASTSERGVAASLSDQPSSRNAGTRASSAHRIRGRAKMGLLHRVAGGIECLSRACRPRAQQSHAAGDAGTAAGRHRGRVPSPRVRPSDGRDRSRSVHAGKTSCASAPAPGPGSGSALHPVSPGSMAHHRTPFTAAAADARRRANCAARSVTGRSAVMGIESPFMPDVGVLAARLGQRAGGRATDMRRVLDKFGK